MYTLDPIDGRFGRDGKRAMEGNSPQEASGRIGQRSATRRTCLRLLKHHLLERGSLRLAERGTAPAFPL
jgi:hypothetical protein